MVKIFKLYDAVIDKVTGKKAYIVYISEPETKDCYIVEPADNSYDPEWRDAEQLEPID